MIQHPHDHYRKSGISWLGEIPSHWTTLRTKRLFNLEKREVSSEDGVVTAFRDGMVTLRSNRRMEGFTNALQEIGYQGVRKGDLVISAMDGFAGAIGVSDSDGKSTPVYSVCTPKSTSVVPEYFALLLRTVALNGFVNSLGKGIRERSTEFRWTDAGNVELPVPPTCEQLEVVRFLERETAQIDALIEKQQRLIDVLGERRSALIARTLTAGLDPAVETAPSSTDWLGNLPEHWQTVPTRYLCKITTGSEDSGNAEDDGGYPLYVRGREILRIGHYSFDCEAVMTPGDGQGGTGKVFHYFNGKFEAHQRVYVFKDFRNLLGRFFYYYLSTFLQPVALAGSNTVTMESLRRPLLASFPVALPPIEEQGRIVDYLDRETVKIDALIGKAKAMNVVLRERRSALISAAVTGKIDVTKAIEGAA